MSGSSFGKAFTVTTWGESHGPAIGVTVQGCPPGIVLDETIIQKDLDRRSPGKGIGGTSRNEPDRAEIFSGVFKGLTTGTPISIVIRNKDADSKAYADIAHIFRPGHADYSYQKKYGIRDYRGGGRASARETAARVAAGAVAQALLDLFNIKVLSFTVSLAGIDAVDFNIEELDSNAFMCPDREAARKMEDRVKKIRKAGDSVGGVVQIMAHNVPPGLGDPVFDKLDADLAKALMSIGAVKGVEIGAGTAAAKMTGSQNNDPIEPTGFATNNAGGILGGISNGDIIVARAHVKPIPSIRITQDTIDDTCEPTVISTKGRHDICAIPRINPVCRAMVQLVIADHLLRHQATAI